MIHDHSKEKMEMHQENKRTLSLSSAKIFRCLVEMISILSILYDSSIIRSNTFPHSHCHTTQYEPFLRRKNNHVTQAFFNQATVRCFPCQE